MDTLPLGPMLGALALAILLAALLCAVDAAAPPRTWTCKGGAST